MCAYVYLQKRERLNCLYVCVCVCVIHYIHTLSYIKFISSSFTHSYTNIHLSPISLIIILTHASPAGRDLGKETPRVNGYNFVTAPSPVPGVDASPLMTWGEVEGTPCQLDGSQTPLLKKPNPQGPSYRIPQQPSR